MNGKTIFDKIWDSHVVHRVPDGPDVLNIDRHFIHEVTSPQAFEGLKRRGAGVFRPARTTAVADHNVPTRDRHLEIREELSRIQVNKLTENCLENNITLYGLDHPCNGIVHVIGPELGITLPGMTIVCGDSHTSTHGAFGCIAFGIGTSEVEMVLGSQCLLQTRPNTMRINVEGALSKGVSSKDMILHIISKIGTGGATGYFVEYAGRAIRNLSMEARMTVCNMSIEMGARGGMIAPDEVTFDYIRGREFAPKGNLWDQMVGFWRGLPSDPDAKYDKELSFDAGEIEPMITWGTNPGMAVKITGRIPMRGETDNASQSSFERSLRYMDFSPGDAMEGKKIDYVFVGSCTNGRIEDLRTFASFVKGKSRADNVTAWIVPGSRLVEKQAEEEGIRKILDESGFEMREPGCSACLAMNDRPAE